MLIACAKITKSAKAWGNKEFSFKQLSDVLSKNIRTSETLDEYAKLDKTARTKIKDVGGIEAGFLVAGATRRTLANVVGASILCLDADKASPDLPDKVAALGYDHHLYTTRSSTVEKPRYRIIFPFTRVVTVQEYDHVCRWVMQTLGGKNFDPFSLRINQVMFFASCSSDAPEPVHKSRVSDPVIGIPVDHALQQEIDYTMFPEKIINVEGKSLPHPGTYGGVFGLFCRTYGIHDTLEKFLYNVYTPVEGNKNLWNYVKGSGQAGLRIYDDAWAYSYHSTDPAADGHRHNAADLIRIHRFEGDTKKFIQWAMSQPEIIEAEQAEAFGIGDPVLPSYVNPKGVLRDDEGKIIHALLNTTKFAEGLDIKYNLLTQQIDVRNLPWDTEPRTLKDTDVILFKLFLAEHFNVEFSRELLNEGFDAVAQKRRYNPLRDKLDALKWDGVPRVETFFIAICGCPDTPLTRTITKKWFAAGIQRVYNPGMKFDSMLILVGDQNIYKSTIFNRLALNDIWFTDSISVGDMADGKKAIEKSMGIWIAEVGELKDMRKVEAEALKSFLAIRTDRCRLAYDRRAIDMPRLTLYVGTSNPRDILSDVSGNRRYWVLEAVKGSLNFDPEQLWAEAKETLMEEQTWLALEDEQTAEVKREDFFIEDPLQPSIQLYLDKLLPADWYERTSVEARAGIMGFNGGTEKRKYISAIEVWCECLGKKLTDIQPRDYSRVGKILAKIFKSYAKKRVPDRAYGYISVWLF